MTARVLHFIDSGGLYGAESVILNLSQELVRLGNYQPVIGCIVSRQDEESALYDKALELGLAAERVVLRNSLFPLDLLRAARLLKARGIGLIHSHGYKPSVYGFFLGLLMRVPVTATCHLWFFKESLPMKKRVMIALELFLYRFFPAIVAVSDPIRDFLLSRGLEAGRVRVINNGIAIGQYRRLPPERLEGARRELGVAPDEICVINVGRLTAQKAQCRLVEAAARLKEQGARVKLFIVGEGALLESLTRQVRELGVEDRVRLLGFRSDIATLLQAADVFALPSLEEGMPIALLEAVACGTPVLTTAVGDIPKLIEDRVSGVLVQKDDAEDLVRGLELVGESRTYREELAQRAFEALRRGYSSEAMAARYGTLYGNLLGAGGGRP